MNKTIGDKEDIEKLPMQNLRKETMIKEKTITTHIRFSDNSWVDFEQEATGRVTNIFMCFKEFTKISLDNAEVVDFFVFLEEVKKELANL